MGVPHRPLSLRALADAPIRVALRDYEGRVLRYTVDLMDQIRARAGEPINVAKWFNYYSFDVMGDLAFGKSFDMLKNGHTHFAIELLQGGLLPLGLFTPIPWMIPIVATAPFVGSAFRRLLWWCADQVEERSKMKVEVPDIASWLLKDPRGDRLWLNGDSRLIIVAGSDTTAIALTHVFYHLASDPTQADRLRAELRPLWKADAPFSVRDVKNADHLNGVIYEALRMHPPVPSGVFRKTPPQGITVDGVFIPGEVNITLPHYVIGRCEQQLFRGHTGILLGDESANRYCSRGVLGPSQRVYSGTLVLPTGTHQEQERLCPFFIR